MTPSTHAVPRMLNRCEATTSDTYDPAMRNVYMSAREVSYNATFGTAPTCWPVYRLQTAIIVSRVEAQLNRGVNYLTIAATSRPTRILRFRDQSRTRTADAVFAQSIY